MQWRSLIAQMNSCYRLWLACADEDRMPLLTKDAAAVQEGHGTKQQTDGRAVAELCKSQICIRLKSLKTWQLQHIRA